MTKTNNSSTPRRRPEGSLRDHRGRRISVRGVRRDPPDLRKLARALIALAQAQAEADAQAQHQDDNNSNESTPPKEAA